MTPKLIFVDFNTKAYTIYEDETLLCTGEIGYGYKPNIRFKSNSVASFQKFKAKRNKVSFNNYPCKCSGCKRWMISNPPKNGKRVYVKRRKVPHANRCEECKVTKNWCNGCDQCMSIVRSKNYDF